MRLRISITGIGKDYAGLSGGSVTRHMLYKYDSHQGQVTDSAPFILLTPFFATSGNSRLPLTFTKTIS